MWLAYTMAFHFVSAVWCSAFCAPNVPAPFHCGAINQQTGVFVVWKLFFFFTFYISEPLTHTLFHLSLPQIHWPITAFHSTQFKTRGDGEFSVVGPKLWNSLPQTVESAPSTDTFKTCPKTYNFSPKNTIQLHENTLQLSVFFTVFHVFSLVFCAESLL